MAASQAAQAGSTPVSRSIHRGCLTKRQPLSACRNRLSAPQGSMPASARQPPRPRQFAERTGPRPCCRGGFYIRPEPGTVYPGPRWLRELDTDAPCAPLRWVRLTDCLGCRYRAGRCGHRPLRSAVGGGAARAAIKAAHSVSKKSFRHAVRIFKLSKKFKNTCRLNAKGAFCPLHTSPAALSQTSSARFFDSLGRP